MQKGDTVEAGDRLLTIEAMKMETAVYAETGGTVKAIELSPGTRVEQHDLVLELDTEAVVTA